MTQYHRDQIKQNVFKKELFEESEKIYGKKLCYASHKAYKSLIASHIKPYKLCVIDNDEYSQFNINNGILLFKTLDDYFDKFLVTFDNEGNIILSHTIPEDIRKDFENYKLDEQIYNNERKRYMEIHRAMFYYKNKYNETASTRVDDYLYSLDENIRYIPSLNEIVICNDNNWKLVSKTNLRKVIYKNYKIRVPEKITNDQILHYLISNCFEERDAYDSKYLVCLNGILNLDTLNMENIKLFNSNIINCNYKTDVKIDDENIFLRLINYLTNNDLEQINTLQKLLGYSLYGKGLDKMILLKGNICLIDILFKYLKQVISGYLINYEKTNILNLNSINNIDSMDCRLLYLPDIGKNIREQNVEKLINNMYFNGTKLTSDRYSLFASSEPINLESYNKHNISSIELTKQTNKEFFYVCELTMDEKQEIFSWLIEGCKKYIEEGIDFSKYIKKSKSEKNDDNIDKWLNCRCEKSESSVVGACDLYEDYCEFYKNTPELIVTQTSFGRYLTGKLEKRKRNNGAFYIGVKLK